MNELITRVREATGLDDATAQTAIGHVLRFMLDHAGESNVAEFVGKIPGAHQAIEAAAATGAAGARRPRARRSGRRPRSPAGVP